MNLWYAGHRRRACSAVAGGHHGRRFAARLMTQMPVIIAMGINLGIVPLLFIQVGLGRSSTRPRFSWPGTGSRSSCLLVPAYYGVYVYAFGLAEQGEPMPLGAPPAGARPAFLVIGFIFANAMSLMENVGLAGPLAAAQLPRGRAGHGA